jgi:hypothetical protein
MKKVLYRSLETIMKKLRNIQTPSDLGCVFESSSDFTTTSSDASSESELSQSSLTVTCLISCFSSSHQSGTLFCSTNDPFFWLISLDSTDEQSWNDWSQSVSDLTFLFSTAQTVAFIIHLMKMWTVVHWLTILMNL